MKERSPAPPASKEGHGARPRWRPRVRPWWPSRPRFLPVLIAAILVLLGMVLALSALEVRSTRVSLNASAEAISFVTAAPTPTSEILLRDLAWNSTPVQLVLPDGTALDTDYFLLAGGPIAVPPIRLAEGTEVTIRAQGGDGRYTFLFSAGEPELELALPPGVRLDVGDGEPRGLDGIDPFIRIRGIEGWFHVAGAAVRRDRIAETIPIRNLSFWREAHGREGDPVLSTLHRGLLVLEEVGGRRIELREGEPLALGGLEGVLRSAALGDGSGLVEVQLDGRVQGLRSGYTEAARSLMPSLLDRLVGIPTVKAILAVAAVLIGALIPLARTETV